MKPQVIRVAKGCKVPLEFVVRKLGMMAKGLVFADLVERGAVGVDSRMIVDDQYALCAGAWKVQVFDAERIVEIKDLAGPGDKVATVTPPPPPIVAAIAGVVTLGVVSGAVYLIVLIVSFFWGLTGAIIR